jgi:hypothetical protein
MRWQTFVDESYDQDGWFVAAGYVAAADDWAAFSRDWQALLPRFGLFDVETGEYYFHMAEMNETNGRMSRVPAFGRVIERHVDFMLSLRFYIPDIPKAQRRLYVPGWNVNHFPPMSEIYRIGWNQMLAVFANERARFADAIPTDVEVDFTFDEYSAAKKFLSAWGEKERGYPLLSSLYKRAPRFENDRRCLPLQAADMLAWRIRRACSEGGGIERPLPRLPPLWSNPKPMKCLDLALTEDGMAEMLMEGTAEDLPVYAEIIDLKTATVLRGRAQ